MQERTRKLWGQEFKLVPGGLSQDEVIRFVNALLVRYRALAEQQQHLVSLGTLAEKAALEARKIASDIRTRAAKEAEDEALRITTRAAESSREIIIEGRRAAQDARQREGETILKSAHTKAAMMEAEAKQRAQLYLIRSREVIESRLRSEVQQVYGNLLSSLQNMLLEGKDVEIQWKGKTLELWKQDELEGGQPYSSDLAADLAAGLTGLPANQEDGYEESAAFAVQATAAAEEPVAPEPEDPRQGRQDGGQSTHEQVAAQEPAEEYVVAPRPVSREAELADTPQPFAAASDSAESLAAGVEAEAPAATARGLPPEPPAAEESEPAFTQEAAWNQSPAEAERLPEAIAEPAYGDEPAELPLGNGDGNEPEQPAAGSGEARRPRFAAVAGNMKYEGEVDLVLVPPIDLSVLSEIHTLLQRIPELRILRTIGSWDKGTTITVQIDKPLALADVLSKIPTVEPADVVNPAEGDRFLKRTIGALGTKEKPGAKNRITLRTRGQEEEHASA